MKMAASRLTAVSAQARAVCDAICLRGYCRFDCKDTYSVLL